MKGNGFSSSACCPRRLPSGRSSPAGFRRFSLRKLERQKLIPIPPPANRPYADSPAVQFARFNNRLAFEALHPKDTLYFVKWGWRRGVLWKARLTGHSAGLGPKTCSFPVNGPQPANSLNGALRAEVLDRSFC